MPAIAITSPEHGPVTIPMTSINVVRRGQNAKAIIVLQNGSEMQTNEDYAKLSALMVSVNIWGSVTTEPA